MSSKLKTFALNSFSNIGISLISNLISIITLPLYLEIYGEEKYGIYILALSLNASLSIIDFGIGAGLKRFVAQFTADKDVKKLSLVISPSLSIVLIISVINSLALSIITYFSIDIFNISEEYRAISQTVFLFASFYSIIFWLTKFSRSIFEGYQLYWLLSLTNSLQLVLSLAIYIMVYLYKLDFVLFSLLSFLSYTIPLLFQFFFILRKKLLQHVKIRLGITRKDLQSDFFNISRDLFFIGIIAFFREGADKYIISMILTSGLVTVYIIITKPAALIRMISSMLFSTVDPLIAKEYKLGNTKLIETFNKEGTLFHFMISTPLIFLGMLFIGPFINLWIGNKYDIYIVWGQLSILSLFTKPYYSLMAKTISNTDSPKIIRNLNFISVGINFIVSVVLTYYIGFGGVVIGTLVQEIIKVPLYSRYFKKYFGTNIDTYLIKNLFLYFLASALLAGGIVYAMGEINMNSWLNFMAMGILSFILFYFITILFFLPKVTFVKKAFK